MIVMMKHTLPRRSSVPSVDAPVVRETVEMFLARGGRITKCPTKTAQGALMYAPVIAVDGHTLPLGTVGNEYLPNFVRDLNTYDIAQDDRVSVTDDGSAHVVREDAVRSMRASVQWRDRWVQTLRRDDADIMEDM